MNKPVLAIDFDDVMAGFNLAYIAHHNRHHGTSLTFRGAYTFDMTELYQIEHEEVVRRVRNFCHHHHHEILPIEGAEQVLRILSKDYALHLVTSRCETLGIITDEWMHRHGFDFFAELHFTNGFGAVGGVKRSKLEVCLEISARALIEDSPGNAEEVGAGGLPVLLLDRPWNQGVKHPNVTRVHSWSGIPEWINNNL